MEIVDPYAHEPLTCLPPPLAFDPFSGDSDADVNLDATELDDYLRAIGVLPPLPPNPDYATAWGAVDYGLVMHLPATRELYAAAVAAQVQLQLQPATPPPPPQASSSYDDGTSATLDAYESDIDATLRATERDARERPSPDYLDDAAQETGGIDPLGRTALVAWMCGLAAHLGIEAAALHRAVSYLDRFLSSAPASSTADLYYQIRVVAAAAVYAAAKLEDSAVSRRVSAGDIAACCEFAAGKEVLDAERALLAALGYRLGGPTAHTFVEHFTRRVGGGDGEELRRCAHAIAGLSLLDHRCCLGLLPSAVAAAAILLARMTLAPALAHRREQLRKWGMELEEMTVYRPADVYEGVESMYMLMSRDPGFGISPLLFAEQSY
ncbi:unnamed protein product [Urochloa humidicola]